MDSSLYFDNHLQTKPSPQVLATLKEAQAEYWASAAAPYYEGQKALTQVNTAAKNIYELIDASPEDSFVFCSSGIDAIEKVFLSFLIDQPKDKPLHIVSVEGEDSFLSFFLDNLANRLAKVTKIPLTKKGQVDLEAFKKALDAPVDLVSLSYANGLTGVIHPIEEMAKICQEKNVAFHVDASYVIGKIFFSFQKLPIDYLTFRGELIHGPKSGALFIKSHKKASPWITGGEKDAFLAHKMDVPTFLGFAESCRESKEYLDRFSLETAFLANRWESKIQEKIPCVVFPLKGSDRLPNVSVICFPHIPSEPFLFYLNENKLCATFGRGFYQHIAKILQLSSIDPSLSWTALSFALSRKTTAQEIDQGVEVIVSTYEKAKRIFDIL